MFEQLAALAKKIKDSRKRSKKKSKKKDKSLEDLQKGPRGILDWKENHPVKKRQRELDRIMNQ